MARKVKDIAVEEKPDPKRADAKALLKRIRERYKVMTEADNTNRRLALEDLRFVHEPGAQWDTTLKKERGDRPCYEFNKLRITEKRVINHIRANRPSGKVRGQEDGDKDTADVLEGLLRNIWNVSDGDTVIDYAAEYVVAGGMGAWRVTTEYSSDTAFEQDIFVRPIKDPFCLYADPVASDPFKRDAEDWILTEKISNASYEAKYPKAKRVSFEDSEFDDDEEWQDEETTRICEYWYKKPVTKTLYLLEDGKTVDKLLPDQVPKRTREVKANHICMVIASGDAILEGPIEWAGSMFPFVMVHGEWRVIGGKVQWHGLTRFSKDAQRAYNTSRTAIAETIALAPTAKNWMTPKQFEGLGDHIAEAHKKNIPVSFYNPDPQAPGPPARIGGADVPVALIQEAGMASEDIKATSGIFDASLGNQSNETSGRAIRARQEQGEIATYNYPDNISKGVRLTFEIIIDLAPKVLDTERQMRVLGADGSEKYVRINQPVLDEKTGKVVVQNDLSRGKYDVTVTAGPSYSTQRQEAAEAYIGLAPADPLLMATSGDLVYKSLDLPYSEQIAERRRAMLPPQIQQQLSQDKPVPPEVQAVLQQAEQAMQVAQQQAQLVQAAAQEVATDKAAADKAKADAEKATAQIATELARFETQVAKAVSEMTKREADLTKREAALTTQAANLTVQQAETRVESQQLEVAHGKADLESSAAQALEQIKQLGGEFAGVAMQIANTLAPPPPPEKPKTKRQMRFKRGPEGLDAQIDEVGEDGQLVSTRRGQVRRNKGEIIASVEQLGDDGQVAGVREGKFSRVNGELVGEA